LVSVRAGATHEVLKISTQLNGGTLAPATPLVPDAYDGRFSRDGRLLAFTSKESGMEEVYVSAYQSGDLVGSPVRVSSGGGVFPVWSRDGKTLFFFGSGSRLMSASLATNPLSVTAVRPLWNWERLHLLFPYVDVLSDGNFVATQKGEEEGEITRYDVVLNFFDELKRKSPSAVSH
jgi:hypothetical protein